LRQISPRRLKKNQISSAVRWAAAREVCPGASSKWAMLPPFRLNRVLTSEPSGATEMRLLGKHFGLKSLLFPLRKFEAISVGKPKDKFENLAPDHFIIF
jgi:hypothetical protein